jgi:hypothetical protein
MHPCTQELILLLDYPRDSYKQPTITNFLQQLVPLSLKKKQNEQEERNHSKTNLVHNENGQKNH